MIKLPQRPFQEATDFTPRDGNKVAVYTCGPTVYNYLHVGNWTAYIYWDILVRTLLANDYQVERVMNITDVGHLVSDADEGEDKLQKGARRENKTAWEVAEFYAEDFLMGLEKLGLIAPDHIVRATDYIDQQLQLVRSLQDKGYTYQIDDGIYFDTSKFPEYAEFAGLDLEAQKAGARVDFNAEKRNASDFALWKFTPAGQVRDMEWETPEDLVDGEAAGSKTAPARVTRGGATPVDQAELSQPIQADARQGGAVMGFPGWHLECSSMAMTILGSTIDIHTGGIDHIPVHHTNEIAQSEAVSGQEFSRFWLHSNHLQVDGAKISKSLDNGYTLEDLAQRGYSMMDFRMFVLQSHYQTESNFTFDNLTSAQNRLHNWRNTAALRHQTHDTITGDNQKLSASPAIIQSLNDNLNTPEALSLVDQAFSQLDSKPSQKIHQGDLVQLLETIDNLLGIQLISSTPDIEEDTKSLILERDRARENKDWDRSDQIRQQLLDKGLVLRDVRGGSIWQYA